jgi:signal transduction histidine kinase
MKVDTLHKSEAFTTAILNSLLEQIAVLDPNGVIISVNQAWLDFAEENGGAGEEKHWVGMSYLDICENALNYPNGDEGPMALAGIRDVLSGHRPRFSLEYPCHSSTEQRWFVMHVTALQKAQHGVVIAHENITQRKLAEIEVRTSRIRLAELSNQLIQAQEKERQSIAWELHDELGQRFTALNMTLHQISKHLRDEEAIEEFRKAAEEVASLIRHVRDMSVSLRPPTLDLLGLEASVEQLLEQHFSGLEIDYVLDCAGLPRKAPPSVEITIYRIVQEAITNITRHANANCISIEVNGGEDGSEIEVIIQDNGKGFDMTLMEGKPVTSLGLIGMRERVSLLGGNFHVCSTVGKGTMIHALLPVKHALIKKKSG